MSKQHSLKDSFKYAVSGIKSTLDQEPNFRIHLFVGFVSLVSALFLNFNYLEWVILLLINFLVIILELVNTSIEAIVDIVSPDKRIEAKIAKDVAASSVLAASVLAIVVGLLLFLPKVIELVR